MKRCSMIEIALHVTALANDEDLEPHQARTLLLKTKLMPVVDKVFTRWADVVTMPTPK